MATEMIYTIPATTAIATTATTTTVIIATTANETIPAFATDVVKVAMSYVTVLLSLILLTVESAFPTVFPAALPSFDLDHSLLSVVDNGASRYCCSIASDFTYLIPRDNLGVLFGIGCPIRGLGTIPVSTIGSLGELGFPLFSTSFTSMNPHKDPAATILAF